MLRPGLLSSMTRIALVCSEPIRESMAGIGIRYLEFARRLPAAGIDAVLVSPSSLREMLRLGLSADRVRHFEGGRLSRILDDCDGIVVQGHLTAEVLGQLPDKPTAIDLYDPYLIENLAYAQDRWSNPFAHDRRAWLQQMSRGDFFLCSSEDQRLFYLGFLTSLGRVNPDSVRRDPGLSQLIAVVPFGVPEELPQHRPYLPAAPVGSRRFLFGGLYDWYDPWTVLEALEILNRPDWSVVFVRNPNPETTPQTLMSEVERWAAGRGWLGNRVRVIDWVPAERRFDLLRDVDGLVATHDATIEAQLSMRTRFLEAMLAGCPVVTSECGPLARLIVERNAGVAVPTRDPAALARYLGGMFDDSSALSRRVEAGRALAAEFSWSRAIVPLLPFCRSPWIDPDKLESDFPASSMAMGFRSAIPALSSARVVKNRILRGLRRYRRWRGLA